MKFSFDYVFDSPPRAVWDALIDWKGHEDWIPATDVDLHCDGDPTAIGAEFTAWTGIAPSTKVGRRLSLEDRMRVDVLRFDEPTSTGECRVTKLGPVLDGSAEFTIRPHAKGTEMTWVEDVKVPLAPQVISPILARIGTAGFRFGMMRLAKQLRT